MAVKLTLPDGSTTDVSTQTARLFVSNTPDGFVDLLKAMRPGLTTPLRMAKYLRPIPGLLGALPVVRDANRIPASYVTVEYHGLARLPLGRRRRQRQIRPLPPGPGRR